MSKEKHQNGVNRVVEYDRSIRLRHDEIHRELGLVLRGLPDDDPANIEDRLLHFRDFISSETAASALHHTIGAKGISATLVAAEQQGDWEAGRDIDCWMRRLPESERLSSANFEFPETYGQKDHAMLSYRALPINNYNGERQFVAVRKRAAADVVADGHEIELTKRTSFLVNAQQLEGRQQRALANKMREIIENPKHPEYEDANEYAQLFGRIALEPLFDDKALRPLTPAVRPASTTYYALTRR